MLTPLAHSSATALPGHALNAQTWLTFGLLRCSRLSQAEQAAPVALDVVTQQAAMRERLPLVVHLVVGEVVQQHDVALQGWAGKINGKTCEGWRISKMKSVAPGGGGTRCPLGSRRGLGGWTCTPVPQLTCVAALASATTSSRTAGTFLITDSKAGT